jgi:hypothetical protein
MANRRSNEHAHFTFLDLAYRQAFRNWAENVQCLKASQQFRCSRHVEDAEETRTSEEFIYRKSRNRLAEFMLDRLKSTVRSFRRRSLDGQNERPGEAASRRRLEKLRLPLNHRGASGGAIHEVLRKGCMGFSEEG